MATYRCDVKQQFGKFSALVWKATEKPGKPLAENMEDANGAANAVFAALQGAGFAEGDEAIFRNTNYPSLRELRTVIERAPY